MAIQPRTDEAIQQEIQDELEQDPNIRPAGIKVTAHGGVVTLEGKVEHPSQRRAAGRAAFRIGGVRAVADSIRIAGLAGRWATDTEIAFNVIRALENHASIPAHRIKVLVQDGQVTLSGTVDTQEQCLLVEKLVRHLLGVVLVIDQITIAQAGVSGVGIKTGIEQAFARHARLDASKVSVLVDGGDVTLAGCVSSVAEREEAEFVAWRTHGVTSVTNSIKVESDSWN
jgi:osmotically-inducible protein OsmY